MSSLNYKKQITEYAVTNELVDNIKKIISTKFIIETDVNLELANYFVNNGGILDVLSKDSMSWFEWKQLKESCKSATTMTIENNGILMEYLSQNFLTDFLNIYSLIYYEEPSFESPENGNDLIFFNTAGNIFIFEVKSKISSNCTHIYLKKKIKDAYTSLFCSEELKNHKKISLARKLITGIDVQEDIRDKIFDLLQEVEKVNSNIIDLCNNKDIFLNICIVGNGFNYTEEELKEDLIDVIKTSTYCKRGCKNLVDGKCNINRLDKSIIFNIISIEFSTELDINLLNNNIVKLIEDKGLDIRC